MSRVRALVYRNKKIIFVNYRLCPRNKYLAVLQDLIQVLEKKTDHSARMLTDMEGAYYDPRLALQWRAPIRLFNAKIAKSAVLGSSPLVRISVQGFLLLAWISGADFGGRIAFFDSRAAALEWLVSE